MERAVEVTLAAVTPQGPVPLLRWEIPSSVVPAFLLRFADLVAYAPLEVHLDGQRAVNLEICADERVRVFTERSRT